MAKQKSSSTSKQKAGKSTKPSDKTSAKASKPKTSKAKKDTKKPVKKASDTSDEFHQMAAELSQVEKDRDRIDGELQTTSEILRATFESMSDGIAVTDEVGNLTGVNESFITMFEYGSREEVIGRNALEFIAESDRERVMMDLASTS